MEKFRSEGHKIGKKYPSFFWNYLVTSKKSGRFFQIFWPSQNIGTLVQPNSLFSILTFTPCSFPLCCAVRFCVRNLSSKLVTAHTLIYSNYIHKCASSLVGIAQCECARLCTRSHMYAHLKRTNHPSMQYSAGLSELGVPGVLCPPPQILTDQLP